MKKIIFLLGLCSVQTLFAHSLHLFAQNNGQQIDGKAYYSDQTPAAETYVEGYLQGNNEPILVGKTDAEGRFRFPITQSGNYRIVVEGEEGHKVSVVADNVQSTSTVASANDLLILREDINQLKNKILVRDIFGGIGYIIGVLGLLALLAQRRKNKEL